MEWIVRPVATAYSDFSDKFGIPRQSGLCPALMTRIEFEKAFASPDYIRGIEGFSHLWLLWLISENCDAPVHATVRPPRLGGNERRGVFATRSPFRPNCIGMSAVKLEKVEKGAHGALALIVSGADLLSGTPILDIKPYLAYADCIPEARSSFAEEHAGDRLEVLINPGDLEKIPPDKREALLEVLSQDMRPSYQCDPERVYGFDFAAFSIKFQVSGDQLTVRSVEKI